MTTMLQRPDYLPVVMTTRGPAIEIVLPVYNEEHDLALSVRRLHDYLTTEFPLSFRITIADNASTDNTWAIASALELELPNVQATYIGKKGRGRALHQIHYVIGGDGIGAANGGSNASSQISTWVASHFTATTVGGVTLYDLTTAA